MLSACSRKVTAPYQASYHVSFGERNTMGEIFFGEIEYQLTTERNSARLKAIPKGKLIVPGIEYEQEGSDEFLIDERGIAFDVFQKKSFYFEPVTTFKKNGIFFINGYNCKLFTTLNNDSLFLTKKINHRLNPFLLTDKSIPYGVIQAKMSDGNIYTLISIQKMKNNKDSKPPSSLFENYTMAKNPFFPTLSN
jgi:hypothetical protein